MAMVRAEKIECVGRSDVLKDDLNDRDTAKI
jgi:hypothetical protein